MGQLLSLKRNNGNGYIMSQLSNGCEKYAIGNEYIHILVAKYFIPNPDNKPTVNHIDGNKSNNCVENLEWATQSEQMVHAFEMGLRKRENLNHSKVKDIRNKYKNNYTIEQLCLEYDTSKKNIKSIVNRKSWKEVI